MGNFNKGKIFANYIFYLFGIMLVFALSCDNNSSGINTDNKSQSDENIVISEANDIGIESNNGKKWKVNEEMKPAIQEIKGLLNQYNMSAEKNYKELAANIQQQTDILVSNCKMDGKAHEELHKWLIPHLKLSKDLSIETEKEEAIIIVKEIQDNLQILEDYFQ